MAVNISSLWSKDKKPIKTKISAMLGADKQLSQSNIYVIHTQELLQNDWPIMLQK